jgi:hypothetical protein
VAHFAAVKAFDELFFVVARISIRRTFLTRPLVVLAFLSFTLAFSFEAVFATIVVYLRKQT